MLRVKESTLLLLVTLTTCRWWTSLALADGDRMNIMGLNGSTRDDRNPADISNMKQHFEPAVDEETDDDEVEGGDRNDVRFQEDRELAEKRRYSFRSDLGKRNQHYADNMDENLGGLSKRYRSFKADLGKRYSRFRSDLGKRLEHNVIDGDLEPMEDLEGEEEEGLNMEKRPRFRSDLGKRNRYEASRRVFRADLGKRRMFRSDLG